MGNSLVPAPGWNSKPYHFHCSMKTCHEVEQVRSGLLTGNGGRCRRIDLTPSQGRLGKERRNDRRHLPPPRNSHGGMAFGIDHNPRLASRPPASRRSDPPSPARPGSPWRTTPRQLPATATARARRAKEILTPSYILCHLESIERYRSDHMCSFLRAGLDFR